jgi:hypothetical protein
VGVTFKPLLTYSNKYTTQITIRTLIGLAPYHTTPCSLSIINEIMAFSPIVFVQMVFLGLWFIMVA